MNVDGICLPSVFYSRGLLIWLLIFSSTPLETVFCNQSSGSQASLITSVKTIPNQMSLVKVLLGSNKTPFCMPSQYVSGVGQLTDGTWRMEVTMFLPDFLSEAVFDKLYPITPSPIFQSPERIRYEHSIMSVEITSSYIGPTDPTGELSQKQGLKNSEQVLFPATNYLVKGYKEYDDKRGNPSLYISTKFEPSFINCFGNICSITEILNHAILIDISLDKTSIPNTSEIIGRLNSIINSAKCHV